MPKVTVILTSYNHAKYIDAAIESVLNQSFTDFELVILDDASTDHSSWLIDQYEDSRISIVRSTLPGEVTWRTNQLIAAARGDYIAMHHSDDIWEIDKLERQVKFLDHNNQYGAVFSNAMAIREDGLPLEETSHFYYGIFNQENRSRHEWLRKFFLHGNALCHPSVLLRKAVFSNCGFYKPWLRQIDDLEMWIRLLLKYEIHVMPEKLIQFRVREHEVQVSGNYKEARIRNSYEYYHALANFKSIKNFGELSNIFPEAKKYFRAESLDLLYVLGTVAVELSTRPFVQLFALDLLLEAVCDPVRAPLIQKNYGFNIDDLFNLTGQCDTFSLEEVAILRSIILERDSQIVEFKAAQAAFEIQSKNLEMGVFERDARIFDLDSRLLAHANTAAELTATLSTREDALAQAESRITRKSETLAQRDKQIIFLSERLAAADDQREALSDFLKDWDRRLIETQVMVTERDHRLLESDKAMADLLTQVHERDRRIAQLELQLSQCDTAAAALKVELHRWGGVVNALLTSRSWSMTRPLRRLKSLIQPGAIAFSVPSFESQLVPTALSLQSIKPLATPLMVETRTLSNKH